MGRISARREKSQFEVQRRVERFHEAPCLEGRVASCRYFRRENASLDVPVCGEVPHSENETFSVSGVARDFVGYIF